jgi:hypothetical protein
MLMNHKEDFFAFYLPRDRGKLSSVREVEKEQRKFLDLLEDNLQGKELLIKKTSLTRA